MLRSLVRRRRARGRTRVVPEQHLTGGHVHHRRVVREGSARVGGEPEADVVVDDAGQHPVPPGAADLARAVDEGAAADDPRPVRARVLPPVVGDVGVGPQHARRPLPHVAGQVEHAERARPFGARAHGRRVRNGEDGALRRRGRVTPRPCPPVVGARRPLPLRLARQPSARPPAERGRIRPRHIGDRVRLAARRHGPTRPVRRRRAAGCFDEDPVLGIRHRRPPEAKRAERDPVGGSLVGIGRMLGRGIAAHRERARRHLAPRDPAHVTSRGNHGKDDVRGPLRVAVDRLLCDELVRVPPDRLAGVRVDVEAWPVRR